MNRKSFIGRIITAIAITVGLSKKTDGASQPSTRPCFLTVEQVGSGAEGSFIIRYTNNGQTHQVVIPNSVGIKLLDLKTEQEENGTIYNTTIVGTLLECLSKLILWDTTGGKFRGHPSGRLASQNHSEQVIPDIHFPWSTMNGPKWKADGSKNELV